MITEGAFWLQRLTWAGWKRLLAFVTLPVETADLPEVAGPRIPHCGRLEKFLQVADVVTAALESDASFVDECRNLVAWSPTPVEYQAEVGRERAQKGTPPTPRVLEFAVVVCPERFLVHIDTEPAQHFLDSTLVSEVQRGLELPPSILTVVAALRLRMFPVVRKSVQIFVLVCLLF